VRAAQIVEYRKSLEVVDIPEPVAGPRDVVIGVEACGICRTDWHLWNGDWEWVAFKAPLPHTPGHEIAGKVVEAGPEVSRVKVGDNVIVPWHLACGECRTCRRGWTNLCESLGMAGFVGPGAYAPLVAIPNADLNVVVVPASIGSLDSFAMSCRYMAAFGAVTRQGRVAADQSVVVVGAGGGMGLSAVQVAAAVDARVIAVDIDQRKLDRAAELGAAEGVLATDALAAIPDLTGGGADVAIDCVSRPETLQTALLSLRPRGRLVHTAYTTQPDNGALPVLTDVLGVRELELVGSGAGMPHSEFPELVRLVEEGVLKPSAILTQQIALDETTPVFEALDAFDTVGFTAITSF
jgi:D-arabinose 1-dehydrogenase-like Zn-dependent alcohol dehydrogenase